MASPFDGMEVEASLRPAAASYSFDLDQALSAVVTVEAEIPANAFTASILGRRRLGNGTVIGPNGLVLTIGYLITEADHVTLTSNAGRRIPGHVLGVDPVTGFGLIQALEPMGIPPLPLGDSRNLRAKDQIIVAGAGGRKHAAAGKVLTRMPFAGYWEYLLENAVITEPAHPHWSGAALIGNGGELLGVGSLSLAGQSPQGLVPLNLFVPIDLLPPILDDLASGKSPYPPRPWLGIISHQDGPRIVIASVSPRGPASRAELRAGDFILAVGDQPVSTLSEFYNRLWARGPAGVSVPLKVRREDDVFTVELRSVDRASLLRKPSLN